MDDNGESIMLCLVNNDPCSTILMTTSGQPLYSITTPHTGPSQSSTPHQPSADRPPTPPGSPCKHADPACSTLRNGRLQTPTLSSPSPSQDSSAPAVTGGCHVRRGSETFVRRLDEVDSTTGLIERTVGTIKEAEDETVTLELPGEKNFALKIPHIPRYHDASRRISPAASTGEGLSVEADGTTQNQSPGIESWDFEGPDHKQYKWFLLGNSPIMAFIDRTMSYPIARYRRAKLGIISRQRKGFLEILPRGGISMDLIVATFVGFMKTCVLPAQVHTLELEQSPPRIDSARAPQSPLPSMSPPTMPAATEMQATVRGASPVVAPSIPSRFQSAASLARKHSRSPPAIALGFSPWSVKPGQLVPTSGLVEQR